MGNKLSIFQLSLLIVFAFTAIIGVAVFAIGNFGKNNEILPPVVIWGQLDQGVMDKVLSELKGDDERFQRTTYAQKDSRTYNDEFVNALAIGQGPDLIFLSTENILTQADKVLNIPYSSYSQRDFRSTFIEEGELYLTSEGSRGLPFIVDPLVMYWNRDIFAAEGIASPPAFWDEFFVLSPRVVGRDKSANITRSFVALGEYRNVVHAKDILSALILQTGNPIVGFNPTSRRLESQFEDKFGFIEPPAVAALRFYTEFSNPVKSVYSWNRSLPDSRQSFISGDLALYFGFASELSLLFDSNPNLNFDVTEFPRSREASRPTTFGRMSALAVSRGSRVPSVAFEVARTLTSAPYIQLLTDLTGLPPVRRDLLGESPTNAVGPVFYKAAISARGWLDPNAEQTDAIYQRMIETTLSGRADLSEAVKVAGEELDIVLGR